MRRCVREAAARAPRRSACRAPALIHPLRLQLEEDNREVLRLLRDPGAAAADDSYESE